MGSLPLVPNGNGENKNTGTKAGDIIIEHWRGPVRRLKLYQLLERISYKQVLTRYKVINKGRKRVTCKNLR